MRRGRGFFANLAKLSRVYQFNCGNTTVISRKELEGGKPESQISSRPSGVLKTSGIPGRGVRDRLRALTNSLHLPPRSSLSPLLHAQLIDQDQCCFPAGRKAREEKKTKRSSFKAILTLIQVYFLTSAPPVLVISWHQRETFCSEVGGNAGRLCLR